MHLNVELGLADWCRLLIEFFVDPFEEFSLRRLHQICITLHLSGFLESATQLLRVPSQVRPDQLQGLRVVVQLFRSPGKDGLGGEFA